MKLRSHVVLGLVLASVLRLGAQTPVLFSSVPVPLVEGGLVALPNSQFALATPQGTYISLQPDGRIETRTAVNSWEMASRVGDTVLRFEGAGTPRYLYVIGLPVPVAVVAPVDPRVLPPLGPMPPDIDTTDIGEVTQRVAWALRFYNCSDPQSLWIGYVMDVAGEGHKKGWTADGYWRTDKISRAEGVGKGYVWPPV